MLSMWLKWSNWVIIVFWFIFFATPQDGTSVPLIASNDGRIPLPLNNKVHNKVNGNSINGEKVKTITCHSCRDCLNTILENCTNAYACFTMHHQNKDGEEEVNKGCVPDSNHYDFLCRTSYDEKHLEKNYDNLAQLSSECCKENFCNEKSFLKFPNITLDNNATPQTEESNNGYLVVILVTVILFTIFLVISLITFFKIQQHRRNNRDNYSSSDNNCDLRRDLITRTHSIGDSTLREYNTCMTSGSGSGMPQLINSTLARRIRLFNHIGKGRYGEVWKGTLNGDPVAVKLFKMEDEDSFMRETHIYKLAYHEHILKIIGTDCAPLNKEAPHYWLVTQYHKYGSLYDYLNRNSITPETALKLIYSALKGVDHLHATIQSSNTFREMYSYHKPSIAHNDIKSKNLLVRINLECVIADFGLAITNENHKDQLKQKIRVGTKRYMSPEVLTCKDEDNFASNFDNFRKADMYSFGLVIWEVLRKTEIRSEEDFCYKLPYYEHIEVDPNFDEMIEIVCNRKERPQIYDKWKKQNITKELSESLKFIWHENPNARPTALSLLNQMKSLHDKHSKDLHHNSINFREKLAVGFS